MKQLFIRELGLSQRADNHTAKKKQATPARTHTLHLKEVVVGFFNRNDVSGALPGTKDAITRNKVRKQKRTP